MFNQLMTRIPSCLIVFASRWVWDGLRPVWSRHPLHHITPEQQVRYFPMQTLHKKWILLCCCSITINPKDVLSSKSLTFLPCIAGFVGQSRGRFQFPLQHQQQPPPSPPMLPQAEQTFSNDNNDDGLWCHDNDCKHEITVKTSKEGEDGKTYFATPLPKRVYSEGSDQEMDIWIQVRDTLPMLSRSWNRKQALSMSDFIHFISEKKN